MQKEAEKRFEEQRGRFAERLEPASLIRADLIGKQEALIDMLYDESSADDDMRQLKAEIDRQKGRLEHHGFIKRPHGRR